MMIHPFSLRFGHVRHEWATRAIDLDQSDFCEALLSAECTRRLR
jgi:hypothetical protein